MASLLSIVEKHGIPCPVKCTTRGIFPFVIIEDFDDNHFIVEYDGIYKGLSIKYGKHKVLKECPTTNDYEYDGCD